MSDPATSSQPAGTAAPRQAAMRFILLVVLIDMLSIGIIVPVLPALVGRFTSDPAEHTFWYGVVAFAFAVTSFFFSPILGALSDTFGRRPILLLGFCGLAINFFATGLATAFWMLIASRVVGGAMQANAAVANAYVADITAPEDRAKRFGQIGAMFGIGFIAGPVIGGLLGGIDLRLPFLFAGCLSLVNLAYGVVVLPESLRPVDRRPFDRARLNPFTSMGALMSMGRSRWLVGVLACSGLAQFTLYTTWVLDMSFRFGWGPTQNGLSLFAVGIVNALVQGLLLGRLLKRYSPRGLAVAGLVSSATSYVAFGTRDRGLDDLRGHRAGVPRQRGRRGRAEHGVARDRRDAPGPGDGRGDGAQQPDGRDRAAVRHAGPRAGVPSARVRLASRRPDVPVRAAAGRVAGLRDRPFPTDDHPGGRARGALMHSKILILDFGSQVTQLIARRIREAKVFCEVHASDVDDAFIRAYAADGTLKGIVLSGSHASTYEDKDLRAPQVVFDLGIPVLGICYGMFAMTVQLGGAVEPSTHREFGFAEVRARGQSSLLDGIADFATADGHGMLKVWMSHGDKVTHMPAGFQLMASTPSCPIAGIADEKRRFYGVQFHPEVTHTVQGRAILDRFVLDLCGAQPDWVMRDYVEEAVASIRARVGGDEVVLGLSGGVDSSVAAALIHRAIGDQLTCVFVDHGLLRLGEGEQVMRTFADHLGVKVIHVEASEVFLRKLEGVADPEAKRKIIGREFVEVFQAESAKLPQAKWLAQGTIYPDVIESASNKVGSAKKATTIKSHHNVGGLPESLHLQLLEPLRELFKDEVRELGVALGLPREMVYRHPFPGPGLGVRILGEVKREYASLLQRADAIFIEELRAAPFLPARGTPAEETMRNWYDATSQAFAVFLPVRSVGVMGDGRTYEWVVALRAVQTTDFMTAHWAPLPHELLAKVSNRIINEVRGINRVVYDISGKPPATIEWE